MALPLWWYRWGFRAAALSLVATAAGAVLVGISMSAALVVEADLL